MKEAPQEQPGTAQPREPQAPRADDNAHDKPSRGEQGQHDSPPPGRGEQGSQQEHDKASNLQRGTADQPKR